MSDIRNILDKVFGDDPESQVTFQEIMTRDKLPDDDAERIQSGKPEKVIPARALINQACKYVRIYHGWHDDNYVWHISPINKQWKVSTERLAYAIVRVMDPTIPKSIKVNIFPPAREAGIEEITFKALELKSCWNIHESDIEQLNAKLFEVLNALL